MYKLGIIGFGSIGRRHCKNLHKFKNEINLYTSQKINLKDIKIYNNLISLIKNSDIIFICSRSNLHYEHIKICLDFKKHIYCEKPITINSKQLLSLTKHKNFKKVIIYPGYQLRSSDLLRKFFDLKQKYNLGKLTSYHGYVGQNLKNWRANINYKLSNTFVEKDSGGILFELIHDIDLINQITNRDFEGFHAIKTNSLFKKLDCDNISIVFKLKKNILGTLNLDYINTSSTRTIYLVFLNYSLFIDFNNSYIRIENDTFKKKYSIKQDRNKIFINHMNNFFEIINKKKKYSNVTEFQKNISYTKFIEKINET